MNEWPEISAIEVSELKKCRMKDKMKGKES